MDAFPFLAKKVLAALILPPAGPLLLAALGLLLLRRAPRLGRVLAWGGVLLLWLLSTSIVTKPLLRTLEDAPAIDLARIPEAQAIVVLGGGSYFDAPEYGGDTVSRWSLERARYAAQLARRTGLPLLVTGGAPFGGRPEAHSMRDLLQQEFGVTVRWVEGQARDTGENARLAAALLREARVTRVLLVTHAWHMPRAQAAFDAAGLVVTPAPTGYTTWEPLTPEEFLPSGGGLQRGRTALHEWLGRLAQR